MSKENKSSGKKRSTVRHTRAIQAERAKHSPAAPPAEEVEAWLKETVHPATMAQLEHYRQRGLRERILTLPVTVALVLSMIWRHIGGLSELVRLLGTEGLLWVTEPQPPEIAWAAARYTDVLVHDGSTLDALVRKVGLLREAESYPLAGRMTALLSLTSRLPRQIWYEATATVHDQHFWPQILSALPAGALLIFDLGYTNFLMFAELTAHQVTFITRAKSNLAYQVEQLIVRYFTQASNRGESSDCVAYLAANAKFFGILKRKFRRSWLVKLDLTSLPLP